VPDAVDIEKLVGELEIGVDRLRSLYEQYFMGIEKLEPTVPRKDVDRRIYALRKEQIRNTAQRFRFQMILQRYNTYQTHWQRVCREIENGTYRRHVMRAQQRFGSQVPAAGKAASVLPAPQARMPLDLAAELAELDKDFAPPDTVDDADVELIDEPPPRVQFPTRAPPVAPPRPGLPRLTAAPAAPAPAARPLPRPSPPPPRPGVTIPQARPAAPAARSAAAPPAPQPKPAPAPAPSAPAVAGDLPDARVRQLYSQYVDAKRRQNESTAAITYDAVAKSLRDSSAKLREKHGKAVDFEVTVKDGKTILKPVLK
jgi:hypothetical protein